MTPAPEIPADVMAAARGVFTAALGLSSTQASTLIARAILAERQRAADWCDKTAFLEWEQGEVRAQRALNKARECILSGDDA